MLYKKLSESLSHKKMNTPFGAFKLSHSVDPMTQGMAFPGTYYREGFQGQIENLSQVETNVHLWEPELPQSVGRTAQTQEDIPSLYSSTLLPDEDVVLAYAKIGTYYREGFQGQIENLSQVETNVHLWEPELPQSVGRTAQTQEDIPSLYSSTLLPDEDVVLAYAKIGTYYREGFQGQIENLSQVETNVHLWEPELPQSLHFLSTHINQPFDEDVVLVPAETGTAIIDFTRLRKHQIKKQKLEISERFDVLAQREDNWDGYDSKKPTQPTLDHAKYLMEEFFDTIIGMKHPWITPFISSNEDGYVTAEWYEEERELHILIRENEAEYLQVWGINIYTEMREDFLSRDDYPKLWEWLLHGQKQREINIYTEMREDFSVAQII